MSSTYETNTSEPVMANDDNTRIPITSLVCNSSDDFYCCGKEDGSVVTYDIPDGKKVRKVISHSSSVSVIKLAWSAIDKYLVSTDDSGCIIAKRLEPPSTGKDRWAVFLMFDLPVDEEVDHFLFSAREEFLLITGPTTAFVMSLKSKRELCRTRHPFQRDGAWTNHPTDPAVVIRINGEQEHQYLWRNLKPKDESMSSYLEAVHLAGSSGMFHRTVQDRGHWLVLEVLAAAGQQFAGSETRRIEVLDLHKAQDPTSIDTSRGQTIDGLARHVRRLIGCFQDRVVFLDHQFWVCTWETEPEYSKHKRHFFLPRDWLNPMALRLMALNKQGTLLCPSNGEVAIVQCGLNY